MARRTSGKSKESWLLGGQAFLRQLKAAPPLPLYALVGSERFLATELLTQIEAHVLGPEAGVGALVHVDGPMRKRDVSSFQAAELFDELRSTSLFAERKLVVLAPADLAVAEHRDLFTAYVKSPSPCNTLVLCLESVDGRTTFARSLKGEHCLAAACKPLFDLPSPWDRGRVPDHESDLTRWLAQRAKARHGCLLDLRTAFLLVELVGNDLGVLAGNLEKLAMLVGERQQITEEDVMSVTASSHGQSSFDLAEGVLSRDQVQSLKTCRLVFRNGLELADGKLERDVGRSAPVIFAGLRRGLLRFLRARRAMRESKMTEPQALEAQGVNRFFLDRAAGQLRQWPESDLQACLVALADLEERSKTGRLPSFSASLEQFMLRFCEVQAL